MDRALGHTSSNTSGNATMATLAWAEITKASLASHQGRIPSGLVS